MKRRTKQAWVQILRRGLALGLTLTVVWVVALTADLDAAAHAALRLGEEPGFGKAVLRMELGAMADDPLAGLDFLPRAALGQSALLRAGADALAEETPGNSDPDLPSSDGSEEEGPLPAETGTAVERTLGVSASQRYDSGEGVYIFNRTQQPLDVAAMAAAPVNLELPEEGPQILIMHTHGTEAYTPDGTDTYQPTDPYRTTDEAHNMIRVGEEIAAVLEQAGFSVLHDTTLYDYPSYTGAYDRSLAGVQALLEQYPTIRVVMDVHRDALAGEDGTVYKTAAQLDGEKSAQVMLVIGSNDNGLSHDNWRENLTLAVHLQQRLNQDWPTLARPISLRAGRYNQQLTTGSILVEVGSHGNTLSEALAAARHFAQSAAEVLGELGGRS